MKKSICCKLAALFIFHFFTVSSIFAQANPKFELYILIGQSNMAGRGVITDDFKNEGNDSVFSLNKANQWVPARHPLHFDKPAIVGVGPGLAFGIAMANANRNVRIGLIPCAVGGTAIEYWEPGAYDPATKTHPFDDAAERIKIAMHYGVIKGIIWHQGEADADTIKSKVYLGKLIDLIVRMRVLVKNPQLPFVAGQIGEFYPGHELINNQLNLLPIKVSHTAIVSSQGLNQKGDNTHFDAQSADELGKRYAVKMIRLMRSN